MSTHAAPEATEKGTFNISTGAALVAAAAGAKGRQARQSRRDLDLRFGGRARGAGRRRRAARRKRRWTCLRATGFMFLLCAGAAIRRSSVCSRCVSRSAFAPSSIWPGPLTNPANARRRSWVFRRQPHRRGCARSMARAGRAACVRCAWARRAGRVDDHRRIEASRRCEIIRPPSGTGDRGSGRCRLLSVHPRQAGLRGCFARSSCGVERSAAENAAILERSLKARRGRSATWCCSMRQGHCRGGRRRGFQRRH